MDHAPRVTLQAPGDVIGVVVSGDPFRHHGVVPDSEERAERVIGACGEEHFILHEPNGFPIHLEEDAPLIGVGRNGEDLGSRDSPVYALQIAAPEAEGPLEPSEDLVLFPMHSDDGISRNLSQLLGAKSAKILGIEDDSGHYRLSSTVLIARAGLATTELVIVGLVVHQRKKE